MPPSTLSLLGLVRHLARVEHGWWRRVIEGQVALPRHYRTDADAVVVVVVHGEDVEVRVVVHLVEEYARHLGHADLFRECIDGRTGQ